MRRLSAVAVLPMTIACESPSSGEGELGNVHYSLSSRHSVPGELTEVGIVTGHPQLLETALTEQGAKSTNRPKSARHFISGGGRAENQDGTDALPDVVLTVSTPGTYLVETLDNEGLLDKIELTFTAPNQVGLQTWVKGPDATDFNERNAPSVPVEVGAHPAEVRVLHRVSRRHLSELRAPLPRLAAGRKALVGRELEDVPAEVARPLSALSNQCVQRLERRRCAQREKRDAEHGWR